MNCNDVSKGLISYLDRRSHSAERQQIEQHLAGCAECRGRAEQFRALMGALDEMPAIEPSFGFDARLRQRIAADPRPSWFAWLVPQPRLALSTALLALMAVWMVKTSPMHPANPAAAQQEDFNAIKNLDVLENYDVLTNMDALSEMGPANLPDNGVQEQGNVPAVE